MREPWLMRPSNEEEPGLRADLGIAGFDDMDGREMLLDVRITDMDCPSNIKTGPPRAILHKHEAEKIRKYRLPAQNIGRTFKPFVMGADGTLAIHAAEVIDTLARKLTKQWDINNPNRHGAVRCWIFNRLTFEIIRASSACLRGYRRNDYAPMVYYDFLFWRPSMNV